MSQTSGNGKVLEDAWRIASRGGGVEIVCSRLAEEERTRGGASHAPPFQEQVRLRPDRNHSHICHGKILAVIEDQAHGYNVG